MADTSPKSRDEMIGIVHIALVEVMTLKQEGLPLVLDTTYDDPNTDYVGSLCEQARFESTTDNQVQVVFQDENSSQLVLDRLAPRTMTTEEETLEEKLPQDPIEQNGSAEESLDTASSEDNSQEIESSPTSATAETDNDHEFSLLEDGTATEVLEASFRKPSDNSWQTVPLTDTAVKFAVKSFLPVPEAVC